MELLQAVPWELLQDGVLTEACDYLPVVLEYLTTGPGELYNGGGGRGQQDRGANSSVWVSAKGLGGGAGADAPRDNNAAAERLKAELSSEQEDPWAVLPYVAQHWRHMLDAAQFPTWSHLATAATQAAPALLVGAIALVGAGYT